MDEPTQRNPVRAGVIVTGTEVLTATIRDENGPWISQQLTSLGIELAEILVVADHRNDLRNALEHMRSVGIDLIITTGGLGGFMVVQIKEERINRLVERIEDEARATAARIYLEVQTPA